MSNQSGQPPQVPMREGSERVLAKLSMPQISRGIARPRLFEILDRARCKAATWIVAPGGAGKTTLTATYIEARQLSYIWYQLDKNDVDAATFFYYLGMAAKAFTQSEGISFPLLTPEYLPDIEGFTRRYFRNLFALLPRGSVLVLDNHHELADAAIFNVILRNAIEEVPDGNAIIIISRSMPPADLARHQVGGMLEIISWDLVRLTQEETAAIAVDAGNLDEAAIRTLHERCEGWAAGLTFLLDQLLTQGLPAREICSGDLETVFDFFASEYFNHLPEATRDFLLKTALLPQVTPLLAEEVTGNPGGGKVLADFHRRHFFTDRRNLSEPTYQYHALFREFLLDKVEQTYSRTQYLKLTQSVSEILGKHGMHEAAVALCLKARHWEMAASIVLAQAPLLLAQGRTQIVAGWIQQLPESNVESNLWLLYWKGISQQFLDPFKAKETLERAYASFAAKGGITGQLLTASAIIDIVYLVRGSLVAAAPWVEVLQTQLKENPEFPSPAMEARVLSSLLSMLELTSPSDPRLPYYAERLGELIEYDLDINDKVLMAGRLIIYQAAVCGNAEACARLLHYVRPLLESEAVTEAMRLNWTIMSVIPYLLADCTNEVARERVDALLGMIRHGTMRERLDASNLSVFETIASYYAAFLYLHLGDAAAAKPLLDRMETLIVSPQSIDMAIFQMLKCLYALVRGDLHSAHKYGEASLHTHSQVGAMISQMEVSCILAIERCESGKPEEAFRYLTLPREQGLGNSPRMHYQVLLIEAYAHLLQGGREQCLACLRDAMSLGWGHQYMGNVFWLWRLLPRLCAEALSANIEADHVRHLVRIRCLTPAESSVDDWPWPVRIYTLGKFELVIDDKPFDIHAKAQNKPLSLLEVLVALGGTAVKRERIADVLWPDAEADAALFTFTTTLARLRKIIGENAISVKSGRISLNERVCWVDVRTIENYFELADKDTGGVGGDAGLLNKVMSLYKGPFLHDEEAQWAGRLRNQLRSKFSRLIAVQYRAVLASGESEQAVAILRRALEVDPDCEEYIHGLLPDNSLSE